MTIVRTILLCKWDEIIVSVLEEARCKIILVADDYDCITYEEIKPENCERFYRVSTFDSIDELSAVAADILLHGYKIDGIISHAEFSQYGAGLLGEILKISPYSTMGAIRTRDKRMMKSLVNKAGVRTARFMALPYPAPTGSVREVVAKVGFPCIVKPANGFGTATTYKVLNEGEYETCLSQINSQSHYLLLSRQLAVEEFINADEYHMDAVWKDSAPVFFSVNRYFASCLEMMTGWQLRGGYHLPREEHAALYDRALAFHRNINKALEISDGFTHTEFFVDPSTGEFIFSEIASRVAGHALDWVAKGRYGMTMREMWAREISGLSNGPIVPKKDAPLYVGHMLIGPKKSGTICRMPSERDVMDKQGVLDYRFFKKVGDKADVNDRIAYYVWLIIGADSEAALNARAHQLLEEVLVVVE